MREIRLIASDLDGTLLLNGAQKLEPDTCDLIRRLQEKGVRFMASSGRQYDNLLRLFSPVRDDIVYLCQNGASACADGRILFTEQIDPELAVRIVKDIRGFPHLEAFVSQFDCCYVDDENDAFFHHVRDVVGMRVKQVPDIYPYVRNCSKISIFEEAGLSDIPYWQKRYGEYVTVVTGGAQWLDIMPKGVNKGTALKRILDYLGICAEEVMVFGDNLNDLEIMDMAGCSATVTSGVPEVLAAADTVCETVEDALRKILAGKTCIEDWKR